jgi:hypothetical protein
MLDHNIVIRTYYKNINILKQIIIILIINMNSLSLSMSLPPPLVQEEVSEAPVHVAAAAAGPRGGQ